MKTKVILVDDEVLITDLLSGFLERNENMEVLNTYNSGLDFLKNLEHLTVLPDVLLIDFRIGDIDGVELLRRIRLLGIPTPIILMSSHYNDGLIGFMVKSGFAAFIPKNTKPTDLIEIISEVNKKGFYMKPEQFALLREQMTSKNHLFTPDLKLALSDREIEVMRLIAQQKTAKEIADILFISPKTVEGHKNSLFLKTGVKNVVGLIVYGVQQKILNIDEIIVD